MQVTIDKFLTRQTMARNTFEIYHYLDDVIPDVRPHTHTFYEVYYVLSDQLEYVVDEYLYSARKGDLFLIPPGSLHYPAEANLKLGNQYHRIVLWYTTEYLALFQQLEPELHCLTTAVRQSGKSLYSPSRSTSLNLYEEMILLNTIQQDGRFASDGRNSVHMMSILIQLAQTVLENRQMEPNPRTDDVLINIIYYIHTHIAENISLEDLSSRFWLSKGHISQLFRQYIGLPVHQYILSLRLDGVRKSIAQGVPIAQAADEYGFQDYSSFYRAFRQAFQISPREYQTQVNAEQRSRNTAAAVSQPCKPLSQPASRKPGQPVEQSGEPQATERQSS